MEGASCNEVQPYSGDASVRPFIFIAFLAAGIYVADTSQAATSDTETPVFSDNAARAAPASDLPACDSKTAIENVKETLANNAVKSLVDVQVLDYDKLAEVSFDPKEGVRVCIGDFVLNIGDQTIAYSFRQAKSDASKVLVQVQALDAIEVYQLRAAAETHNETPEQKAQEAAPAPACDSQFVRSELAKMTPQNLYLQHGIDRMESQLGWYSKSRHLDLGSDYKEESFDANSNQRECAVSINVCFQLDTGENYGSTQARYSVRKLGQEIIVNYSEDDSLEFKPSSAATASPEQAASPAVAETTGAQESSQPSNLCGAPYPCRLQAIIDHSDWQSVLSALSFAMQTNVKTQVKWSSKVNDHKGYVQQSPQGTIDQNCKVFLIASAMGADTGTDKITACQVAGGGMTFK